MMYRKALLMGDATSAQQILTATTPSQVRKLGQSVKPWDENLWLKNRLEIMYTGCFAKFSQNPPLKEKLLATGNTILVEASPPDRIWGIGLAEDHPDATSIDKWQGLNLLGQVLMKVREDIKSVQ